MGTKRTIRREVTTRQERLNRQTKGITACLWPGCDPASFRPFRHQSGYVSYSRVGPLCYYHADLITDAVFERRGATAERWREMMKPGSYTNEVQKRDKAARHIRQLEKADEFRGDMPGFVYYLRVGERIKVGYSVDVKRRMRQYPPGCTLLAVEPGDRDLERKRHQQFRGSLLDGREWFRPTPDLMELVDEVVSVHGEPKQFAHHYRRKTEPVRIRRPA
jgi:hypothetical protein